GGGGGGWGGGGGGGGGAGDAGIRAIAVREALGFHFLADAALIVVDGGQVAVGRPLVEEQRQRLAPPLQAALERRIGLREFSGGEIGASQLEATDPGVQQFVRLGQRGDGVASVSVFQRRRTFENFRERARLDLALRGQAIGARA